MIHIVLCLIGTWLTVWSEVFAQNLEIISHKFIIKYIIKQTHLETTERQWKKCQYTLVCDCVSEAYMGKHWLLSKLGFCIFCVLLIVIIARWQLPKLHSAPLTRMTFSMSLEGHQWNIPVESYLFTFMSMFSICSFPGIRRGSCRLKNTANVLYDYGWWITRKILVY